MPALRRSAACHLAEAFVAAWLLILPLAAAAKPLPRVTASFEGERASVALGTPVALTLRLTAGGAAPAVRAEVLPVPGLRVVSGPAPWRGALAAGQVLDLPVVVELTGVGEYTLGARVTARTSAGRQEVSGATLSVVGAGGVARLSRESHAVRRLREAQTPADLARLGVATPAAIGAPLATVQPQAATAVVTGTVQWQDPEGHLHPVRAALVQILDGPPTGFPVATTFTNLDGVYSVPVTGPSQVSVRVFTMDFTGGGLVLVVSGSGAYFLEGGPVPLAGTVTLDLVTARPVRGAPGAPTDVAEGEAGLVARAFSVFDAMVTYWVQATTLLGSNLLSAVVTFPHAPDALCPTSCANGKFAFIHREDAFDWDVIGHEFTHVLTSTFSARAGRVIDTNPGGQHSEGSAIGQDDGTGHLRTREEGMRLAWSEGLATFFGLALQLQPVSATVPFPSPLLTVGNALFEETEDAVFVIDPEHPVGNEGFGSEESVLAVFWDLFDSARDTDTLSGAADAIDGVTVQTIWNAITVGLPCDPCDRVDKFWLSLVNFFGPTNSTVLALADLFALNAMAPAALDPADGAGPPVTKTAPPRFEWLENGDPSPNHRNNAFVLAISSDHLHNDVHLLAVPSGQNFYTPTAAEWQGIVGGLPLGTPIQWLVAGQRDDAPTVPPSFFWLSNTRTATLVNPPAITLGTSVGAQLGLVATTCGFHNCPPPGDVQEFSHSTTGAVAVSEGPQTVSATAPGASFSASGQATATAGVSIGVDGVVQITGTGSGTASANGQASDGIGGASGASLADSAIGFNLTRPHAYHIEVTIDKSGPDASVSVRVLGGGGESFEASGSASGVFPAGQVPSGFSFFITGDVSAIVSTQLPSITSQSSSGNYSFAVTLTPQ